MDRTNKPEQYLVITDFWLVMRKYLESDFSDDVVSKIIAEIDETYKKHNTPFALGIGREIVNELDRIAKRKGKEHEHK